MSSSKISQDFLNFPKLHLYKKSTEKIKRTPKAKQTTEQETRKYQELVNFKITKSGEP